MSDLDRKLDDFPYLNPGYGRNIAVVGVGSAGCRITNQLSKESKLLEHFLYVACDGQDLAPLTNGERILVDASQLGKCSPFSVRGLAQSKLPEICQNLTDSKIVFVIAGLGGNVGSGIAPLIAKEASERGAITVAILVMPFNFEKSKHFFAGAALRQIRNHASGVIIIDNDELLQSNLPIIDLYADVNNKIALALSRLIGTSEPHEFAVGLNNVINFVKTKSYSVLCIGNSESEKQGPEYRQAVVNAVNHFEKTVDRTQASRSIVHLFTDKSITMNDLVTSIGGLSGMLGNGTMQIEYGLSANSTTTLSTAVIMATGFSATKFDRYDPVDAALGPASTNLDSDMDGITLFESLLPSAEMD